MIKPELIAGILERNPQLYKGLVSVRACVTPCGMIVRPRLTLLSLLFAMRGSILPQVAPTVIGLTAFAALVVAAEQRWSQAFPVTAGVGPFTLIGLALSIFLSFRDSACYDPWWEARKLWGALIVETRGLVRTLTALLQSRNTSSAPDHPATPLRLRAWAAHEPARHRRGAGGCAVVA